MVDATRALLDELMGKERNVPLTERSGRRLRFDDPAVCKYDLGGLCPHGLFRNTKSDLGACTYEVHSDHIDWQAIKEEYEKQDDREKERYEKKLMGYLDELIREMDRKIAKARERAEKESAPRPIKADDQLRLDELNQRAKDALEKSQKLGEEGDVDAAMMLSQQAEAYKKQYDEMFRRLTAPERTMTVCEVCGVFISATDMDKERWGGKVPQPILDHLNGKQYLGWKAVREQHAKLKEKYGSAAAAAAGTSHRERDRSRGRDDRDRDRERDRSERDRGDRDRERDRDRGSGYERDRGGGGGGYDRAGYDRSRDRGGYDRGYERDRERGGGYGSYGGRERDRYPEERRRY